jgi:hypothetical protein
MLRDFWDSYRRLSPRQRVAFGLFGIATSLVGMRVYPDFVLSYTQPKD